MNTYYTNNGNQSSFIRLSMFCTEYLFVALKMANWLQNLVYTYIKLLYVETDVISLKYSSPAYTYNLYVIL